jgi:hypothetical protein
MMIAGVLSKCGGAVFRLTVLGCLAFTPALAGATTCSTVAACIFGNNTDPTASGTFTSAAGVSGQSLHGDGVDGATTYASTSTLAKSGVSGIDKSTSGTHNNGVFGFSASGTGVHGSTTSGAGIVGVATSLKGFGVVAQAPANGTALNVVAGNASSFVPDKGTGVALTTSGTGLRINALNDAIDVQSQFGYGLSVSAGAEGSGVSITTSENDGLDINTNGTIGEPYALFVDTNSPVALVVSGLMSLDSGGNLTLSGSLLQNGVPAALVRATNGRSFKAYGAREADATIEDVGEATMTNGHAAVALDPTFASTLDPRRPYFVFLTAEGDNRGLFVAVKTNRGFVIRECNGGMSTLNVQYRIVAKPYDAGATTRLANVDPTTMPYGNAAVRAHAALLRERSTQGRAKLPTTPRS